MTDPTPAKQNKSILVRLLLIGLVLVLAMLARLLIGSTSVGWPSGENAEYIRNDRIMGMLLGLIVGVALSISGVSLQALLRNPLAEPYILGLSTGAGAGMMIQSYVLSLVAKQASVGSGGGGAVLGAAVVMLIVFVLGRRKGVIDPLGLLLTGVVLSTICGALILMMNYLIGPGGIRNDIARWMMGNLDQDAGRLTICIMAGLTLLGLLVLLVQSRAMDVASSSDAETMSLGVNLPWLRVVLFAVASLLAAGAVVLAGPIAFVGLICPHVARLAVGPRHGVLLIGSAMLGAALVIAADTTSALLHLWLGIGLMPIGIFTAIVGGPVFLWMLRPQLGRGDS